MPQARQRGFFGVARETTKGTAVATPTDYIPFDSFEFYDDPKMIQDKAVRASAVETYNLIQGPTFSSGSFGGPVFAESHPRLAHSLLGDLGQTGTTAATVKTGTIAAVTAGAVTAQYTITAATPAPLANDIFQFDTGNGAEIRKLTSVTGAGPYTINWAVGLQNAHAISTAMNALQAPYTNNIAILNTGDTQGPALTVSDFNGFNMRQFPGVQISELTYKMTADGLLEKTGKGVGYGFSATNTTTTPSFTAGVPQPAWAASLTFGGAANTKIESFDLTLARSTAPIHNLDATQGPYKIWQGPLKVTGKMVFVYEDDTDLVRYLNNTQPTAVIALVQAGRGITFTMTKCAFVNPTKKVITKDYAQLDVTFEAVANTTDVGGSAGYSPIKIAIQSNSYDYTT